MIFFIVCFLGFTGSVATFLRIPSPFTPVFIISVIGLILYVAGLTGSLLPTADTLKYIGVLLFFVSAGINIARKNKRYFYDTLLLLGLILFCASLTLIGADHFRYPDELHFWGKLIRFLYQTNQFPTVQKAHFGFLDYPPGAALFQYFVLQNFHQYSDAIVYLAQELLIFSCVFITTIFRDWKRIAVAFMLAIAIISNFKAPFLYCIYVDTVVGCFFAAILMIKELSTESATKTLLILLPIFCYFILIKQIAFPLSLLALFLFALNSFRSFVMLLLIAACCVLTHYSWLSHYRDLGVHHTFNLTTITLQSVLHNFSTQDSAHTKFIIHQFLFAFFLHTGNFSRLFISPFMNIVLLWLVYFVLFKKLKQRSQSIALLRRQAIALTMGAVIYSAGLLILYIHSFCFIEAKRLASMGRYLGIYYTGWSLIVMTQYLKITAFPTKRSTKSIVVCMLLIIIALVLSMAKHIHQCAS